MPVQITLSRARFIHMHSALCIRYNNRWPKAADDHFKTFNHALKSVKMYDIAKINFLDTLFAPNNYAQL